MEPSNQNPSGNDISSHVQKPLHDEDISESHKSKNSTETSESSNIVQKVDVTERNINSTKETLVSTSNTSNEEGSVDNLEKENTTESVVEEPSYNIENRQVIMVYDTQNRPRQPFFQPGAGSLRLPSPPAYYQTAMLNTNVQSSSPATRAIDEAYYQPLFHHTGIFSDMFGAITWASYPSNIPSGVPPGLAHLVDAEVLFIIQKIDILFLTISVPDLNMFIIQNKHGENLYLAYETTTLCGHLNCRTARNFQIHIVDIYQNEVIYLNKPCGSTYFCCCYPVIEVYAPPMIPVGAIMKVFNPRHEEFVVLDPDENEIFRISGSHILKYCCYKNYIDYTFTIYALDSQKTVVGYIKRDLGGFIRTIYTEADVYGVSFPKNMDARTKAVFLGALFLIDVIYFDR